MFKDPVAVWNQVRAPILGIDTRDPGVGPLSGTPYWNVDMSLNKSLKILERASCVLHDLYQRVQPHRPPRPPTSTLDSLKLRSAEHAAQQSSQYGIWSSRQLLTALTPGGRRRQRRPLNVTSRSLII